MDSGEGRNFDIVFKCRSLRAKQQACSSLFFDFLLLDISWFPYLFMIFAHHSWLQVIIPGISKVMALTKNEDEKDIMERIIQDFALLDERNPLLVDRILEQFRDGASDKPSTFR